MAQPPRVAEALALFLSRAGVSALASSSSATRRAVARAAACSSAAGPSSDYWTVAVCSSDAILAALRISTASAARRVLFDAAASPSKGAAPHVLLLPPPRASEPAPLLSTDTVAGAADPSASSSTTSLWRCLAGPSSDYWTVAVCSSNAILAALRISTASAARRALFHAAASPYKGAAPHVLLLPPPRASEPAPLLSTDTVAGAADPSASSSTTSLWRCLAGGWDSSELVLAAVRSNPNPAAASGIGLQFWASGISYPLGFPVTASPPRPPFTSFSEAICPWMRQGYRRHGFNRPSLSSVAHYWTSSHESLPLPPPLQSVENLILLMNEMTFNEEDTVKFKQAFYAKFQTLKNVDDLIFVMNEMTFDDEGKAKFKQAFYEKFRTLKTALGIAEFLHYQKNGYAEWLCILKVITQKTGPHKEAMDLQIKEDLSYSEELEAEFTNDAAKARTQVKLDMILKGQ